jgi:hypothetical protein
MANRKISELDGAGALNGEELVEVVRGGTNLQTTVATIVGQAFAMNFTMGDDWNTDDSFSAFVDAETLSMLSPDVTFDPNEGSARLVFNTEGVYRVTVNCTVGIAGEEWPEAPCVIRWNVGSLSSITYIPIISEPLGQNPDSLQWTFDALINTQDGQGPYGMQVSAAFLSEIPGVDMTVQGFIIVQRLGSPT